MAPYRRSSTTPTSFRPEPACTKTAPSSLADGAVFVSVPYLLRGRAGDVVYLPCPIPLHKAHGDVVIRATFVLGLHNDRGMVAGDGGSAGRKRSGWVLSADERIYGFARR